MSRDRYGAGFLIAHDAAAACLAILYWWESSNELHQRIYAAPLDCPRELTPLDGTAVACVWDLEVVEFERRAWLDDVLANPTGPDIDRYLTRHFSAEV